VDLGFAEVYIGRAVECVIRTDDPMVSRRHARIYFQDGRHIIEDLGSANGIFVSEQRVQMHNLQNGDGVRCGNLYVRYSNDGMMQQQPSQTGGYGGGPPPAYVGGGGGGFGAPPPAGGVSFGGGPPPAYGSPPPAMGGGGMSYGGTGGMPSMAPPAASPSMAPNMSSSAPPAADGSVSASEASRMQRRIDQLSSEVRMLRGGGDKALRMEELESKISMLERDKQDMAAQMQNVQAAHAAESGEVRVQLANLVLSRAEEVVNGLNDVLSELRINILSAEGEVEQWSSTLPRASFDLVRESLRSCRGQMETARDLMRQLREAKR
jgi:hypothetical protein